MKFKNVLINEEQVKNIVEIGLKYDPTPWEKYGSTVEEIVKSVIDKIIAIVKKEKSNYLFEGITYSFPSTILMFSKVWEEQPRKYSTTTVRVNLLYQPSNVIHSHSPFPVK